MKKWVLLCILMLVTGCGADGSESVTPQSAAVVEEGIEGTERDQMNSERPSSEQVEEGAPPSDEPVDTTGKAWGIGADESFEEVEEDPIAEMVAGLSDEDLVGQMFFLDLLSYESTGIPAGGIIFFKPDLDTWEGVQKRISDYQAAAEIPLFMGIDEEGGIVSRITGEGSIGGTVLGSAWSLAHSDDPKAVYKANETIAAELGDLGFNMNFAPVADINSNPDNPIIGKRAFSDTPEETAYYVVEALEAYENSNVIPVVKHFPGHGDTKDDSHDDLVYIDSSIEDLWTRELVPFQAAIDDGVRVVMIGHIVVTGSENDNPASMNSDIIQGLLRQEMGFNGLVISDSMHMGSISNHMTSAEAVGEGLTAGLDMFLMPEDAEEAYQALLKKVKTSPELRQRVEASVIRIIELKDLQMNSKE